MEVVGLNPGANSTIVSYNTSAVKIYNANSLAFKILFYFVKRSSLLHTTLAL
jgi:hypothetical protein